MPSIHIIGELPPFAKAAAGLMMTASGLHSSVLLSSLPSLSTSSSGSQRAREIQVSGNALFRPYLSPRLAEYLHFRSYISKEQFSFAFVVWFLLWLTKKQRCRLKTLRASDDSCCDLCHFLCSPRSETFHLPRPLRWCHPHP